MTPRDIADTIRSQADEIDALRSEAILRGVQVKNLMAEIQRLKAEMSVHETPDGGLVGMLTITPEAARGLMEGDE